jgi:hypothetical protein
MNINYYFTIFSNSPKDKLNYAINMSHFNKQLMQLLACIQLWLVPSW